MKNTIYKILGQTMVSLSVVLLIELQKIGFWYGFLFLPVWVFGWGLYDNFYKE